MKLNQWVFMIALNLFKSVLDKYLKAMTYTDKVNEIGLDLYESPVWDINDILLDEWGKTVLTEDGMELLYWWLFEDTDKIIYADTEIDVASVENFYNYLKDNGYFID